MRGLHCLVIISRLAKEGLGGAAATAASLLCLSKVGLFQTCGPSGSATVVFGGVLMV